MTRLARELALAFDTAREIGARQLEHFRGHYRVLRKEAREFVTSIDMECHDLAAQRLGVCAPVASEEVRGPVALDADRCWIVDPLDGSHNYIAGLAGFAVSIALVEGGRLVLGVIAIPAADEVYHAVEGEGAYLGDRPIRVSANAALDKAMVAYDNQFHLSPHGFDRYQRLVDAAFTTRILGCAAVDLALIAQGRIDARVFNATKIYDVAAGIVLVREAGGRASDLDGAPIGIGSGEIAASNGGVHAQLLAALKGAGDEETRVLHGGIGLSRNPVGGARSQPAPRNLAAASLRR